MKKIIRSAFFIASVLFAGSVAAQDANVSVSNLSSNSYYAGYSNDTKTISGINFEILSDGDNSDNVFDDSFQVSLYLIACDSKGVITGTDPIIIKSYTIDNMHQMGAADYTDKSVDLSQVSGLAEGTYRLGVWVDSDEAISSDIDDRSDNAFSLTVDGDGDKVASIIAFTNTTTAVMNSLQELGVKIPNPTTAEELNSIARANGFEVNLYDLTGQKLATENTGKGMYMMSLSNNNKVYSGKIVLQ